MRSVALRNKHNSELELATLLVQVSARVLDNK